MISRTFTLGVARGLQAARSLGSALTAGHASPRQSAAAGVRPVAGAATGGTGPKTFVIANAVLVKEFKSQAELQEWLKDTKIQSLHMPGTSRVSPVEVGDFAQSMLDEFYACIPEHKSVEATVPKHIIYVDESGRTSKEFEVPGEYKEGIPKGEAVQDLAASMKCISYVGAGGERRTKNFKVPDQCYEGVPKPSSLAARVMSLERHDPHMINRHEEEFAEAMVAVAAAEENVGSAAVQQVHRTLYDDDGRTAAMEFDAILRVPRSRKGPVVFLGSTKFSSNGLEDVKELKDKVRKLKSICERDEPPMSFNAFKGSTFKMVFMAETLGASTVSTVPTFCAENGIIQMRRTHGSITRARPRPHE